MILSAQTIRYLCSRGGLVQPFSERTQFNGCSYGLSSAGYDVRVAEDIDIAPQEFVLASTVERFDMPLGILGIVHDKSTWGRVGIAVQNTVIEPGWKGFLTIELTNHGREIVKIPSGTGIAQIVFHRLDGETLQPYNGKYQDQNPGPQRALFEFGGEIPCA